MDKRIVLIKTLLQKYHSHQLPSFYHFFSENDQHELAKAHSLENKTLYADASQWFEEIHYSWIESLQNTLSPEEKPLFNKTLSKKQRKAFAQEESFQSSPFPQLMQKFFRHYFVKKIMTAEKIDLSLNFYAHSKLSPILNLNKSQLIKTIDLLGIHDLAAELKNILDRSLLEKIYAALTKEQLHFLHYCSKITIKWHPPKLHLNQWDGNPSYLQKLLHQRGLIRFSKALVDEDAVFIWHICHRLDIGRGKAIEKTLSMPHDSSLTYYFKEQILHLVKRFKLS